VPFTIGNAARLTTERNETVSISASQVKELRELTGAGIMESKRALEETGGNIQKAVDVLRQRGLAKADKKAGRIAAQGLVEPYIHAGGRIGAIVELNCETDFVARTEDFRSLAHDLAMQVAATKPRYLNEEEIQEGDWAELESEFGDRKRAIEATVFLAQPFIKNPRTSIGDLVRGAVGTLGENIVVRRFARFEIGELSGQDAETEE
jgi:elongation factor Ts